MKAWIPAFAGTTSEGTVEVYPERSRRAETTCRSVFTSYLVHRTYGTKKMA